MIKMTIKEIPEIITCTYCKSGEFEILKGKDDDKELHKCKKCGALTDFKLRQTEDEKHKIYHETGKEPEHEDLAPTEKKKPSDDNENIQEKPRKVNITHKTEVNSNEKQPEIYN